MLSNHTHCQADQSSHTSHSLSKTVSEPARMPKLYMLTIPLEASKQDVNLKTGMPITKRVG